MLSCGNLISRITSRNIKLLSLNTAFRQKSDCGSQKNLKDALADKIQKEQERIKKFRKENGKVVLGQVTVNMIYGGMRGLLGLFCDTSLVNPEKGITFREHTIPQIQEQLPKVEGGCEPLPEGLFYLLLTGDIPSKEQVTAITNEWNKRSCIPEFVEKLIDSFPVTLHPMAQLSAAMLALSHDSAFTEAYNKKVPKTTFWEYVYEDSMTLIAQLPLVCARIYRNAYHSGENRPTKVDKKLDWSGNFVKMCGYDNKEFAELMRLYLTIHSDHEGGNVSAHTVHLVGSALSDPYSAYSAGMSGLAGPLHGLANQEVLVWLKEVQGKLGKELKEDKLKEIVQDTLKSGRVIPGYGHAVLRQTDPRFLCQQAFASKHLPDDELFKLVTMVFKVVPPILKATGKVQNPWPNVDAHSGVLLQYYGMTEMSFYTVLFAMSRALGVLSSLIWHRALGIPIERPKSITTNELVKLVSKIKAAQSKDCK